MNLLEKELHYPLGDALPAPGFHMTVAPDVHWLRMALPFALDHINLWLIRDQLDGVDGWCIVDCCLDNPQARAQWQQVFDNVLMGLPVLRVLATHLHPDHLGLAHWLCDHWQVPLYISATDYHTARTLIANPPPAQAGQSPTFFRSHGLQDPQVLAALTDRSLQFVHMVPALPSQFVRLTDGMPLQIGAHVWQCISGYGHAPEHIALYCPDLNVLISGDMVLPKISTNVSVYAQEPEGNALALFLASLKKFDDLPEDTLVLPSHGRPFKGLHTRTSQLHAHHQERLEEVMQACAVKASSAHDMLPVIFKRPLNFHQTTFAMGESVAHLHLLWYSGQLKRRQDAQGVWRFSPN